MLRTDHNLQALCLVGEQSRRTRKIDPSQRPRSLLQSQPTVMPMELGSRAVAGLDLTVPEEGAVVLQIGEIEEAEADEVGHPQMAFARRRTQLKHPLQQPSQPPGKLPQPAIHHGKLQRRPRKARIQSRLLRKAGHQLPPALPARLLLWLPR